MKTRISNSVLTNEQALKYFGNECNVISEILLSRRGVFISQGMITKLTTNISATEIENTYGTLKPAIYSQYQFLSLESIKTYELVPF